MYKFLLVLFLALHFCLSQEEIEISVSIKEFKTPAEVKFDVILEKGYRVESVEVTRNGIPIDPRENFVTIGDTASVTYKTDAGLRTQRFVICWNIFEQMEILKQSMLAIWERQKEVDRQSKAVETRSTTTDKQLRQDVSAQCKATLFEAQRYHENTLAEMQKRQKEIQEGYGAKIKELADIQKEMEKIIKENQVWVHNLGIKELEITELKNLLTIKEQRIRELEQKSTFDEKYTQDMLKQKLQLAEQKIRELEQVNPRMVELQEKNKNLAATNQTLQKKIQEAQNEIRDLKEKPNNCSVLEDENKILRDRVAIYKEKYDTLPEDFTAEKYKKYEIFYTTLAPDTKEQYLEYRAFYQNNHVSVRMQQNIPHKIAEKSVILDGDTWLLDMTKDSWTSLPATSQIQYAKEYQKNYAEVHKMEIRKVLRYNSIEFAFCLVPPGKYIAGSPDTEEGRLEQEKQEVVVIGEPFYMLETETMQGQWCAIMRANNPSESPKFPQTGVSYSDVSNMLDNMNKRFSQGYTFRLPRELEWEFACRAGTTSPFGFGNQITHNQGIFAYETRDVYGRKTRKNAEVVECGSLKSPNAWGLLDMHGNVHEWCIEPWTTWQNYEKTKILPSQDPVTIQNVPNAIMRGGCYGSEITGVRSALRTCAPNKKEDMIGFRIVLILKQ